MSFFHRVVNSLSRGAKPSNELVWAVKFLGWKVKPFELIGLSRLVLLIIITAGLIASLLINSLLLVVVFLCVSITVSWLVTQWPKNKARLEALKALGYGPDLITMLVSSLELNPNLELAVKFAADYGEGRIANDLLRAYNNSLIKGLSLKHGLMKLGDDWGRFSEGFKQSIYLLISSVSEKNSERRSLTLNNCLSNYLQSVVNELNSFSARVKLSTTVLFSFGTVIPLVIVSLVPVISVVSTQGMIMLLSSLFSLSLIMIYAYSNHILSTKPGFFSQVKVSDKPGYPDKGNLRLGFGSLIFDVNAWSYCAALFLIISSASIIYLGSLVFDYEFLLPKEWSTLPLVVGFGVCLSVYYHGSSGYKVKDARKALILESEVLDVIYNIGSRVDEGRSVEQAFKKSAAVSEGRLIHDYLASSYLQSRDLSISIDESVSNSLSSIDSSRVKSVFRLFFNAVKKRVKGSSGVIYRVYNYFQQLVQSEKESNNKVKQLLSTMDLTAVIICPLISAVIIILQQVIQGTVSQATAGLQLIGLNLFISPGISFELLQAVIGFYMLLLLIVLVRYVVIIQGGNDVFLKQKLSKSIITGLIVYSASLIIGAGFA